MSELTKEAFTTIVNVESQQEYTEYLDTLKHMEFTACKAFIAMLDKSRFTEQLLGSGALINKTLCFLNERGWLSPHQLHEFLQEGSIQNVRRWFSKDHPVEPREKIWPDIVEGIKSIVADHCAVLGASSASPVPEEAVVESLHA